MKRYLIYIFFALICFGYFLLRYVEVTSFRDNSSADASIYNQQLFLWSQGDFESPNTIRNAYYFYDHLSVTEVLLVPFYYILGWKMFLVVTPLLLILLPLFALDLLFKELSGRFMPELILLSFGLYLSFSPLSMNAIMVGFHSIYLLPSFMIFLIFLLIKLLK